MTEDFESENRSEDESFDEDYDEDDLKSRLDGMEKRLMKMEEMMVSFIEQNQVSEDDEEFEDED